MGSEVPAAISDDRLRAVDTVLDQLQAGGPASTDDLMELTQIVPEPPHIVAEAEDHEEILRRVLISLGVVRGSQGTRRVRYQPDSIKAARSWIRVADQVLAKLRSVPDQVLGVDDITAFIPAGEDPKEWTRWVQSLLSTLGLAAGRRRTGGLKAFERVIEEVEEGDAAPAPAEPVAGEESEHESKYYEAASVVLSWDEYRVLITGVNARRSGEWRTPDVVGYRVYDAPGRLAPVLRISTIEVKWRLTLAAIAEAEAHRRFSHYAYLATPEPMHSLDPELVRACVEAGIGLVCRKQLNSPYFYVYVAAPLNQPDELEVEALLADLSTEDGSNLVDEVAELTRAALYRAAFPSGRS